jgi:hypothetical protein
MPSVFLRVRWTLPRVGGAAALLSVGALLVGDAAPRLFPADIHKMLSTLPLVLTAVASLLLPAARRARPAEWGKAVVLAFAFFFWAASQIWVDKPTSTLFNDVAVALFVLDVVLVIMGGPTNAVSAAPSRALATARSSGASELLR